MVITGLLLGPHFLWTEKRVPFLQFQAPAWLQDPLSQWACQGAGVGEERSNNKQDSPHSLTYRALFAFPKAGDRELLSFCLHLVCRSRSLSAWESQTRRDQRGEVANLVPVSWCSEFSCPSLVFLFTPSLLDSCIRGTRQDQDGVGLETKMDLYLTDRGMDLQRLEKCFHGAH